MYLPVRPSYQVPLHLIACVPINEAITLVLIARHGPRRHEQGVKGKNKSRHRDLSHQRGDEDVSSSSEESFSSSSWLRRIHSLPWDLGAFVNVLTHLWNHVSDSRTKIECLHFHSDLVRLSWGLTRQNAFPSSPLFYWITCLDCLPMCLCVSISAQHILLFLPLLQPAST